MATSGRFDTNYGTYENLNLFFTFMWNRTSVNVADNSSTIHYSLQFKVNPHDDVGVTFYNLKLVINGKTVFSRGDRVTYRSAAVLSEGDVKIKHDSNGTKSFSASFSGVDLLIVNTYSGSGTWTLDPIARVSSFTAVPSTFKIGDTVNINISRASTKCKHDIFVKRADGEYHAIAQNVDTSYAWNTDLDWLRECVSANATQYTNWMAVRTKLPGVPDVDAYQEITAILPENETTKPSVSITVTPNNTEIPVQTSGFIQYRSKADIAVTAEGKYGATITSVNVTFDGKTYTGTSITSDIIKSSGRIKATVTVTDTRGFTTSAEKEITVFNYDFPSVIPLQTETEVKCYRADENGNESLNGAYVRVEAAAGYDESSPFSASLYYRARELGAEWPTMWITLSNTIPIQYDGLLKTADGSPAQFDIQKAYNIELKAETIIEDISSIVFSIPSEAVPLHLGERGDRVGLGRYAADTPKTVSVGWATYFDETIYIKGADGTYMTLADYIRSIQ